MPDVMPEDITYKEPTPREIVVEILADALCELIIQGRGPGSTWDMRLARPRSAPALPEVEAARPSGREA